MTSVLVPTEWVAERLGARGVRRWNDANVLCLSLRTTSEVIAKEILGAWFEAQPDPSEAENIEKVRELDRRRTEG